MENGNMGKIRRRKGPSIKATGGKNHVFNPATSLFVQMVQRYGESERYTIGEPGAPMIDNAPVVMECQVEVLYETPGFDNFICTIQATFAEKSLLNQQGKLDYHTLKPVLFEMPTYEYMKTGDVLAKCMSFGKAQG